MTIRSKKKWISLLLIGMVIGMQTNRTVLLGENRQIEQKSQYKYWDWDKEEKTHLNHNNLNETAIVWDDEYVYLYIEENNRIGNAGSFTWGTFFRLVSNQGITRVIRGYYQDIEGSEDKKMIIQGYPGAEGIGHKMEYAYCWELKLPISQLGDNVYKLSLKWESGESIIEDITDLSGKHTEQIPPIIEPGTITIDGHFADWKFIPRQEVTYGSHSGTGNHWGRLYVEEDKIYGYFKMNELYGRQMPLNSMVLTVNGKRVQFSGLIKNPDNSVNWSNEIYNMPVGIRTDIGVFADGGIYLGNAALRVYDSNHTQGDEYEFCIYMQKLAEFTGMPIESMKSFELSAPNIGSAVLSAYGTSTAPIVGIVCSLLGVGYMMCIRKKRKGQIYE